MKKIAAVLAALLVLSAAGCSSAPEGSPAELDYLEVIKPVLDRPDADLLEAGRAACDQILDGRDIFQVQVFDDDTNDDGFYHDSVRVALAAAPRLCPDVD